jgi:hypothetical protein
MSRLHRFEDYRYIGTRDTMRVYDTDDAGQSADLQSRLAEDNLLGRTLLQAFSPDTLVEAANRGFRALRVQETT